MQNKLYLCVQMNHYYVLEIKNAGRKCMNIAVFNPKLITHKIRAKIVHCPMPIGNLHQGSAVYFLVISLINH